MSRQFVLHWQKQQHETDFSLPHLISVNNNKSHILLLCKVILLIFVKVELISSSFPRIERAKSGRIFFWRSFKVSTLKRVLLAEFQISFGAESWKTLIPMNYNTVH